MIVRVLIATALLLIAGCQRPADSSEADGGFLRVADKDDIPTLDPARGYDTASWQFEDLLFNTLLDYDQEGKLAPELATSWSQSDDKKSYTFQLRHDAHFTNGRLVEARDIKFAIERVLTPATKSPAGEFFRGLLGAESCTNGGKCQVDGIEVLDSSTIRFVLREIDPLFLHKLAMPFASAVPEEEVARWGEDFARHPLGSGPFVLREWQAGQRLVFVANAAYFVPGKPRVAGVVRLVGVNDDLAWLKYEAGQLDIATSIPAPEFPRVIREARYQPLLRKVTTLRTQYLGMNCRIPPFDDKRVRQAMNYAVNKEKMLRLINGRGVVAKGFVPPNMPDYVSPTRGYPFHPVQARALLAEAGHADGFKTTMWIRNDDTALRLAQSVQQDLADVGIDVRIKPVAWASFLEAIKTTDLVPLFLLGWEADFPDPANFLEVLLHSKFIGTNNNTNYSNREVDTLLDDAARTADPSARRAILEKAEGIAFDDAPWVFLYHPVAYEIVSQRVRDFELNPLRPARFDQVWLAQP
ncbi:MAG TPA: ABC transporter substrate-binding protein [Candidatus Acidoferrales bacterium]|nr:ABC transporter substrate-binding protein [Candidatus Acidoferrales bacterium]